MVVDLALNQAAKPWKRINLDPPLTICGRSFPKMYRGKIFNLKKKHKQKKVTTWCFKNQRVFSVFLRLITIPVFLPPAPPKLRCSKFGKAPWVSAAFFEKKQQQNGKFWKNSRRSKVLGNSTGKIP